MATIPNKYKKDLEKIISFERANPGNHRPFCKNAGDSCWEWDEVGISPGHIHKLITMGFVKKVFSSNNKNVYTLTDRNKVDEVLSDESEENRQDIPVAENIDENFLDGVIGHEDVKWIIKRALKANSPIHVLLSGAPSTAKSLILEEVYNSLPAYYILGSSLTKAGIREILMEFKPKVLIIDEIDKVKSAKNLSVLLAWMESGVVGIDKHKKHEKTVSPGWLFASANRTDILPHELLSRFVQLEIKPYGEEEFERIATKIIQRREFKSREFATEVAESLKGITTDPRDALKVARLSEDREDIKRAVKVLFEDN